MNIHLNQKILSLKKEVQQNIAVHDELICGLCDQIIALALTANDHDSIAFGHIWRADNFFYVHSNLEEMKKELEIAQKYINEDKPSELLEKFCTMQSIYYENIHDIRNTFQYCLKALQIAEALNLTVRIGASFGNIGSYFLTYECYNDALQYTLKAIDVMEKIENKNHRYLRILLYNLISIYINLKRYDDAFQNIQKLCSLPLAIHDLKIYIDCAKLSYYASVKDADNATFYLSEFINDEVPSRLFGIEFLMSAFDAVIKLGNKTKAYTIIDLLQSKILEDEYDLQISLTKLKIRFFQVYHDQENLQLAYKAFYESFRKAEKAKLKLKVNGLITKLELTYADIQKKQSLQEIQKMQTTANLDDLTKVYNKHYLKQKQNEILHNPQYQLIGYVLFDVDYFKEYNDVYGHMSGDQVLIEVATCLKSAACERIAVCRYGGDEFISLCWNMTMDEISNYVKHVREKLAAKKLEHCESQCLKQVTLSIGYGVQRNSETFVLSNLFEQVDKALYLAKNEGRNTARSIHDLV